MNSPAVVPDNQPRAWLAAAAITLITCAVVTLFLLGLRGLL